MNRISLACIELNRIATRGKSRYWSSDRSPVSIQTQATQALALRVMRVSQRLRCMRCVRCVKNRIDSIVAFSCAKTTCYISCVTCACVLLFFACVIFLRLSRFLRAFYFACVLLLTQGLECVACIWMETGLSWGYAGLQVCWWHIDNTGRKVRLPRAPDSLSLCVW